MKGELEKGQTELNCFQIRTEPGTFRVGYKTDEITISGIYNTQVVISVMKSYSDWDVIGEKQNVSQYLTCIFNKYSMGTPVFLRLIHH